MIEQIIRVTQDLYGVTPVVHMVQGDTGRTLKCVVADYAFTGAETVSLMCLRPDKSVYRYDGTVDTSDNSASFDLNVSGGALTQAGVVAAQVITVLNGAIVASFAINVIVHEVVGGEATEEDITFLMQLQEQLNEWIADAQTDVDGIIADAQELIEEMVESMDEHFIPVAVTWAEYQALPDDKYTNGKIYFITDRGAEVDASTVPYNHTTSGLTATNVQDAIDEVIDESVPKTRTISGLPLSNDITLYASNINSWTKGSLGDVDLNDYHDSAHSGWYWVTDTCSNVPSSWGFILILAIGNVTNQIFYAGEFTWKRQSTDSGANWSDWAQLGRAPYIWNDATSYSVPTGSPTVVKTVILPKGNYVVTATIIYPANATGGWRRCAITGADTTSSLGDSQCPPCTGGASTRVSCSAVVMLNGTEALNLIGEQNSGSALSVNYRFRAIRIS